MESLPSILKDIYIGIKKQNKNLQERKQGLAKYLLTEVSKWTIETTVRNSEIQGLENYIFHPREFVGTEKSAPFSVRLTYNGLNDGDYFLHDLVFGNFEKHQEHYRYEWDKNDPLKLQKSLFLLDVLNQIATLIQTGKIEGIAFLAYMDDGLGPERMKYFTKLFKKLGSAEFEMKYDNKIVSYKIVPKKVA